MSGYILPYKRHADNRERCFFTPNATVVGNVTIGSQSSIGSTLYLGRNAHPHR